MSHTPTAAASSPATFLACIDCMQWIAGITAEERGEEYPRVTVDAMTDPDAASWDLANACGDDCADTCHAFTYAPCDLCSSWLAGERHAVAGFQR